MAWYGPATVPAHDFGVRYSGVPCDGIITGLVGRTDNVHATPHSGLDIAAPLGTAVGALCPGTVRFVSHVGDGSWGTIFGNSVILDHDDGRCTLYAHFRDQPLVAVGNTVDRGHQLGVVGSTGQSTGPHLHLGMTTTANPWFQKDSDGGTSRLLDPLDFIAASESGEALDPTVVGMNLQLRYLGFNHAEGAEEHELAVLNTFGGRPDSAPDLELSYKDADADQYRWRVRIRRP